MCALTTSPAVNFATRDTDLLDVPVVLDTVSNWLVFVVGGFAVPVALRVIA